jgi:DNA-binding LytR/AlgR family response regulator
MKNNMLVNIGSRKNISPKTILMLKSDANYTTIYLEDGSKILSSTTLGKIEKRLKDFKFFRPNRSVVLNLDFMADFEGKTQSGSYGNILLKNNEKVALSRRKSEAFFKIIK